MSDLPLLSCDRKMAIKLEMPIRTKLWDEYHVKSFIDQLGVEDDQIERS